jgi:hypothetical protein
VADAVIRTTGMIGTTEDTEKTPQQNETSLLLVF